MSLATRTLGGYPVNKHSSALRRSGLDLKHDALPICLCRRVTGLHDIILRPESLDRSSTHRAGAPAKAISMLFNIEADWTLNLLCNYDCAYCFSRASTEHRLVGRMSQNNTWTSLIPLDESGCCTLRAASRSFTPTSSTFAEHSHRGIRSPSIPTSPVIVCAILHRLSTHRASNIYSLWCSRGSTRSPERLAGSSHCYVVGRTRF